MNNGSLGFIVNADDLGLNSMTNLAIVKSLLSGDVSSATIMSNMPAFDEACSLLAQHKIHDCIGIHLNLAGGPPLTSLISRLPRFCNDQGYFDFKLPRRVLRLKSYEGEALYQEMDAQVERVLKAGIRPTHVDSHQHIHTVWPIGAIVIDLARKHGLPAVRIARNIGRTPSVAKRVYKRLYNRRLEAYGLKRTEWLGHAGEASRQLKELRGLTEIVVHPCFDADGNVVDRSGGKDTLLRKALDVFRLAGPFHSFGMFRSM